MGRKVNIFNGIFPHGERFAAEKVSWRSLRIGPMKVGLGTIPSSKYCGTQVDENENEKENTSIHWVVSVCRNRFQV